LRFANENIQKYKWNNVHIINADGEYVPLVNNFFDLVLCCETLEHVNNEIAVLNEINRISKKDSILVISVPIEFGLILLFKQIIRRLFFSTVSYSLKELWYACIVCDLKRIKRYDHKGYDYRNIITFLPPEYKLIKKFNLEDICKNIKDEISLIKKNYKIQKFDIVIFYVGSLYNFPDILLSQFTSDKEKNEFYIIRSGNRESKINLDISQDTIKIMPAESCKGLEFKIVFLVGIDELPRPSKDKESERTLAYVAMTRAQDKLYIYFQKENDFVKDVIDAIDKFSIF